MPDLVLISSPLLGPAVWEPVARELRDAGWSVYAPGYPADLRTSEDVLRALLDHIPCGRDLVLVPHSNAGLHVAAVAARRQVSATVFVDAGIPSTGGLTPPCPRDLLRNLEALADEAGMLPVWTEWWTEDEVAAAVPVVVRARIAAEQHRLPLAYFRSPLPTPCGWDVGACAYLAFGDTYLEESRQAADRGWPVVTMAGDHLHMALDPVGVARELLGLLDVLGISSSADARPTR